MTILAAARVVTPQGVLSPGWVVLADGRIVDVGEGTPSAPQLSLPGMLLPGFVDIHSHGGGGASYDAGDPEQVVRAAATHLAHGTTTMVASLVSAAPERLLGQVQGLADLVDDGVIAGIHLEGPWLAPRFRGAHDPAALRDPTVAELDRLVAAGRGHVRMITLAPERSGALDVIRAAVSAGVTVAVGHTDASYEQVAAAVDAGATVGTHLFNAMRPLGHRDPGPIAALTEDPRVWVELIVDGVHLAAPTVRLARRAASGRIILVTDAMSAAGGDDGDYLLGTMAVVVTDGVARLVEGGAIAGSTLTMDAAFRRFVTDGGASIEEASRAASGAGATAVHLTGPGAITPGASADLVHLDESLHLVDVWRAGERIAPT